jgi:large subunit ribosomal protein L14
MIQLHSRLRPADNSGAKKLRVIHIHGGSRPHFAGIGDIVTCAVDGVRSGGQVEDGQVVKAIIVRTKKEHRRPDGSYIRFGDNAAVVIEDMKSKRPMGTRVFGPIAREIKEAGHNEIVSQAREVL